MADDKTTVAAVYVGWTTFKNALDILAEGVPNVIDRSAFPSHSWGVQSQLITGFKFLGLIDEEGKPTAALHALAVTDETARKKKLDAILRERYADLFALDLMKTTPAQLDATMADSYKVSGDTKGKAVRFFLSAVEYVGVPVSRFLKRETGGGGASSIPKRRRTTTKAKGIDSDDEPEDQGSEPPRQTSGPSRTITLRSGGTITMTAAVDILSLNDSDHEFIRDLLGKLNKYEQGTNEGGAAK